MRLAVGAGVAAIGLALVLGAGSLLGGCKEDLGDHCVVDDDCASGLLCNHATGVCATAVMQDASPIQDVGLPMDAAVAADAPADAAQLDAP